jgi:hypothetical protein
MSVALASGISNASSVAPSSSVVPRPRAFHDLLEFSNDALAAPLISADPKLLAALQPFCDMASKERGTAKGTLRSAVENGVEKLLPHGKAQARTVAKLRALQRV